MSSSGTPAMVGARAAGAVPLGLPPGQSASSLQSSGQGKRRNWRKNLFRLHGWMGLNLGLLLFVICFSGSIATISHEIDWLVDARHRVPAQDAAYDWTAMHETLAETFPDGRNLGVYAPEEPGFAALAYVNLPTGQTRKVYLNPYTGELQGHTSFFNAQRFFRSFHRQFFDGHRGILVVGGWGFVLLFSTLTGFLFYRGWIKQLTSLRWRKGRRLRWSDLHKTTGIWALLFALLIALTGVFYFVEVLFQAADNYDALLPPPLAQVDEASLLTYGSQPALLPVGAYVAAAKQAYPKLDVRSVRIPQRPGQAVYVDGQAGNVLTRDRADKVHLHPFTAEVLGIQKTGDLGVVPFVTDAVDPLHFGTFGGLWTKAIWLLFGLVLSFSILAGTYLWVIRSETARGRSTSRWMRGAPVAAVLTLVYFGLAAGWALDEIKAYGNTDPMPVEVDRLTVGPYDVRIDCAMPCDPEAGATYGVRFLGEGLPNYAEAAMVSEDGQVFPLEGPSWRPEARTGTGGYQTYSLRITLHDGSQYEASFEPPSEPLLASATPLTEWPDTAPGVWVVVVGFVMITAGLILTWLYMIGRTFRQRA
ncbi:MAG: PepSY-associated TM helix domain-containing protein [Bacteroidota bacterium]